jgi:hypothetical protein
MNEKASGRLIDPLVAFCLSFIYDGTYDVTFCPGGDYLLSCARAGQTMNVRRPGCGVHLEAQRCRQQ